MTAIKHCGPCIHYDKAERWCYWFNNHRKALQLRCDQFKPRGNYKLTDMLISKLSDLILVLSFLTAVLTAFTLVDCVFLYRRITSSYRKISAQKGDK